MVGGGRVGGCGPAKVEHILGAEGAGDRGAGVWPREVSVGRGRRVCEGPAGDAGDRVGSVSLWGVCAGSAWACGVGADVSRRTVRAARSRWQVWAVLGPGSGTLGADAGGEGARVQRAGCGTPGACGASAAGMHLALRLRVAGCTVRARVLSL